MPTYQLWIAGQDSPGQGSIDVRDPSTGDMIAKCQTASKEDVDRAVQAAHEAYTSGVWSRSSRHHRADVLDKCAELLTAALPNLIATEVQQTGRVVREMKAQVPSLVKWFKYYASILRVEERPVLPTAGKLHNFVDRVPLGVVAQITPFNHPLLIAVKKVAPALAAGNSIILKPSELTPLTSLMLGEILHEAGVPAGVFNVLSGTGYLTGKHLISNPLVRKVDVTGGTKAGREIGAIAGAKLSKYTAELGGKAPLVVFENADLDVAVNGIAFGSFIASGQTCIASTRIIVQNSVKDKVLEKLKAKVEGITARMGAPSNPDSMMGPLISLNQLANVTWLVQQSLNSQNAELVVGGERMEGTSPLDGFDFTNGYFFAPTILKSRDRGDIRKAWLWRQEAFGPVIIVIGFDTEQQAIELANDTEFGLGAGIWTKDLSQAFRVSEQIDAGIVWVNTHHRNDPSSPWGGAKSASGVGSENGIDAYHAYTTMKSTIINYAPPEESLVTDDWFGDAAEKVRYG